MQVTYPPIRCLITGKTEEYLFGLAMTLPETPHIKIACNHISEEWQCGDNVVFRAKSADGQYFTPIKKEDCFY